MINLSKESKECLFSGCLYTHDLKPHELYQEAQKCQECESETKINELWKKICEERHIPHQNDQNNYRLNYLRFYHQNYVSYRESAFNPELHKKEKIMVDEEKKAFVKSASIFVYIDKEKDVLYEALDGGVFRYFELKTGKFFYSYKVENSSSKIKNVWRISKTSGTNHDNLIVHLCDKTETIAVSETFPLPLKAVSNSPKKDASHFENTTPSGLPKFSPQRIRSSTKNFNASRDTIKSISGNFPEGTLLSYRRLEDKKPFSNALVWTDNKTKTDKIVFKFPLEGEFKEQENERCQAGCLTNQWLITSSYIVHLPNKKSFSQQSKPFIRL